MQRHMKHIIPLRRQIHLEMPPRCHPPALHPYILPRRDPSEDVLEVRDVLHRDLNGESLPVENIAERRHVPILNKNGDAPRVQRLDHTRARYLVAARADAVLALPHHCRVGDTFREIPVDLDVRILVLPMLEKNRPDRAMEPARKEGEDRPSGSRWPTNQPICPPAREVDLWDRHVLRGLEPFGYVRIA